MRYRRASVSGGAFFFTLVTENRRPLFGQAQTVALLMECIDKIRNRHPFQFDGYVVLPDHLHALWTLPDGDTNFSTRWRLIMDRGGHLATGRIRAFAGSWRPAVTPRIGAAPSRRITRFALIRPTREAAAGCRRSAPAPRRHPSASLRGKASRPAERPAEGPRPTTRAAARSRAGRSRSRAR